MVNFEFLRPRSHSHNSAPFPENPLRPRTQSLNSENDTKTTEFVRELLSPKDRSPGSAKKLTTSPKEIRSPKEKFELNELYDVKVVDRDSKANKIKIHYVGFSKNYDKWISIAPHQELDQSAVVIRTPRYVAHAESFELRKSIFLDEIRLRIKDHLRGGGEDDIDVSIALSAEEDIYDIFKYNCTTICGYRTTDNLKDLEQLFGVNWWFRIYNKFGDFSFIRDDSFKIFFKKRTSIPEYVYSRGSYTQKMNEVPPKIIFRFVRGNGDRRDFQETFLKKYGL